MWVKGDLPRDARRGEGNWYLYLSLLLKYNFPILENEILPACGLCLWLTHWLLSLTNHFHVACGELIVWVAKVETVIKCWISESGQIKTTLPLSPFDPCSRQTERQLDRLTDRQTSSPKAFCSVARSNLYVQPLEFIQSTKMSASQTLKHL